MGVTSITKPGKELKGKRKKIKCGTFEFTKSCTSNYSLNRNVSPKVNNKPSLPSKPIGIQHGLARKDAATETQTSSAPGITSSDSPLSN